MVAIGNINTNNNTADPKTLTKRLKTLRESIELESQRLDQLSKEINNNTRNGSRLTELTLQGVRNYREKVSIKLNSKITLIYAENGVGKTSLVDALEKLESGKTTRGEYLKSPAAETKDDKVLPSWGQTIDNIKISATSDSGKTWSIQEQEASDSDPFMVDVITKRTLRNKIDNTATGRFDFLSSLVSVSDNEDEYEDLKLDLSEIEAEFKTLKTLTDEIYELVGNIGIDIGDLTPDSLHSIHGEESPIHNLEKESSKVSTLQHNNGRLMEKLGKISIGKYPGELKPERPNRCDISESELSSLNTIVGILEPGTVCPTCNSGKITEKRIIEIRKLLERESDYLAKLKSYERTLSSLNDWKSYWKLMYNWKQEADILRETIASTNFRFVATDDRKLSDALNDPLGSLPPMHDGSVQFSNLVQIDPTSTFTKAKGWVDKVAQYLMSVSQSLERQYSSSSLDKFKVFSDVNSILDQKDTELFLEEARTISATKYSLDQAKRAIVALKTKRIDVLFAPIKDRIAWWWVALRPASADHLDIGINIPSNNGKAKTNRATLECINANGEKLPAVGVLSESQLDALALSFRLAAHEAIFGTGLLWLDDLTDSLDSRSSQSFTTRLVPELVRQGVQTVIVTHDERIVNGVWNSVSQIKETCHENSPTLVQVDLDLAPTTDGNMTVCALSHDWRAARSRYRFLLDEVRSGGMSSRWRIANRLRLANTLRVYCEYLFADSTDLFTSFINGNNSHLGMSSAHQKLTLGNYSSSALKSGSFVRSLIAECELSATHKCNILDRLDSVLDSIAQTDSSVLNAGSHASARIPTFDEIVTIGDTLDNAFRFKKQRGQLKILPEVETITQDRRFSQKWNDARLAARDHYYNRILVKFSRSMAPGD